jgi:hypothetical protein
VKRGANRARTNQVRMSLMSLSLNRDSLELLVETLRRGFGLTKEQARVETPPPQRPKDPPQPIENQCTGRRSID